MVRRVLRLEMKFKRIVRDELDWGFLLSVVVEVVTGFKSGESSSGDDVASSLFVPLDPEGEPTKTSKNKHKTILVNATAHGIQGEISIVIAAVKEAMSSAM